MMNLANPTQFQKRLSRRAQPVRASGQVVLFNRPYQSHHSHDRSVGAAGAEAGFVYRGVVN